MLRPRTKCDCYILLQHQTVLISKCLRPPVTRTRMKEEIIYQILDLLNSELRYKIQKQDFHDESLTIGLARRSIDNGIHCSQLDEPMQVHCTMYNEMEKCFEDSGINKKVI